MMFTMPAIHLNDREELDSVFPLIPALSPGERIPRNEFSRIEPLNRSRQRESAVMVFVDRRRGLTSAATIFMGREMRQPFVESLSASVRVQRLESTGLASRMFGSVTVSRCLT